MTWRRGMLLSLSVALTFLSFLLLSKLGSVDLRVWMRELRAVKPGAFALLVLLTAVHISLANWKWRCVDDVVRRPSDSKLSWSNSFALTSLGTALGQVLPVQACMALARSAGTYLYGSPLRRGTVGTIFEQGFDAMVVAFLAVASGLTWVCHAGSLMWTTTAVAMIALAILAVGTCIRVLRVAADFYHRRSKKSASANVDTASASGYGFLKVPLGRRLMLLSAVRSLVQILMAAVAATAIGIEIPTWKLAAALPFVILATVLAITPGGLGVTELTYAGALSLFGIPLQLGAQWALANRAMVLCSCFLVAMIAGVFAVAEKLRASSNKEVIKDLAATSDS